MERKIILASKSPRRKQILSELGFEFEVNPSNYEEELPQGEFIPQMIEELAYNKAKEVATRVDENCIVLGADTMVIHNSEVLGKPVSREDAFRMLQNLSGDRHYVVTGVAVIDNKTQAVYKTHVITYVTFENWTTEMINYYIDTFNPMDKAGAYGIQELPQGYVKSVEGEFDNVVGLPSSVVKSLIENCL